MQLSWSHITAFLDPAARVFGIDGVILLAFILGFPANELVMPLIVMGYLVVHNDCPAWTLPSFRAAAAGKRLDGADRACTLVLTVAHAPCSTTSPYHPAGDAQRSGHWRRC